MSESTLTPKFSSQIYNCINIRLYSLITILQGFLLNISISIYLDSVFPNPLGFVSWVCLMTMKVSEGEDEDDGDDVFELGEGNVGGGCPKVPKANAGGEGRVPKGAQSHWSAGSMVG